MSGVSALALDDIQGDILVGLQKDYELFCFFEIVHTDQFKRALRMAVAPLVTACAMALNREAQCAAHSASTVGDRLPLVGLNLGFTAAGLAMVLGKIPAGMDPAFVEGAAARARLLNDPVDTHGMPSTWSALQSEPLPTVETHVTRDFPFEQIHGVLLITGAVVAEVAALRDQVMQAFGEAAVLVYQEMGHVRFGARGHEHFGFRDSISQPGIRGLAPQREGVGRPEQGLPGQDLLWPGEFVLGYPRGAASLPGPISEPPANWMRNGSYMVFRRLRQFVPEFRDFTAATARAFDSDEELLAARLVGRWKSGAPLALTPLQDDLTLGADRMRNNDFDFGTDSGARRCPFGAHIRKTNPRDDLNAAGGNGLSRVQHHRIRRAGIPFGPEVAADEFTTRHDRGLMFVCYQSSIENQFEFVQREWANNPEFPPRDADNPGAQRSYPDGVVARPGEDPLIGQSSSPDRARRFEEVVSNYPRGGERSDCPLNREFVQVTAAGYFFMPAISALTGALSE